jgi:hypothetical protein
MLRDSLRGESKVAATIIRLERFNVGCRHHANGVRFPHVYRVTGFEYDFVGEGTNNTRLVLGKTVPVEPFYTLSEIGDHGIANTTVQPIKSPNPDLDKGWLIIRHHANEQPAHGYIDCISDYYALPYHHSGQVLWQTSDGIFTLIACGEDR